MSEKMVKVSFDIKPDWLGAVEYLARTNNLEVEQVCNIVFQIGLDGITLGDERPDLF